MNCTACGAPLLEGAKFCNKCGQPTQMMMAAAGQPVGTNACPTCGATLLPDAKFCNGCGAAVGAEPTPEPSGAPGSGSQRPREPKRGALAKPLAFALLGVLAVAAIIAGALVIFGGGPSLQDDVQTIQDATVEVLVAKSIGDEIMAGGSGGAIGSEAALVAKVTGEGITVGSPALSRQTAMQDVADRARAQYERLREMSPSVASVGLFDYSFSVERWALQVSTTAEDIASGVAPPEEAQQAWGTVPSEPPPFTADLAEGDAIASLERSMGEVAAAKGAGDQAIASGDREAMRRVAARLQAQKHWLSGVPILGSPQCRWFPRGSRASLPCGEAPQGLARVVSSAQSYVAGQPDAPQQWSQAWPEALPFIQGDGQPIGGTGITQGEEPPAEPPWFQAAVNNCQAIGGRVERSERSYAFSCYYGTALATQCIFNVDEAGTFYPDPDPRCEPGVQPPPPDLPPGLPPELLASGGDLEAFADACVQVNGIYPGLSTSLSGSSASGYTCVITASVEDFSYSCSITLYPSGSYDYSCQ